MTIRHLLLGVLLANLAATGAILAILAVLLAGYTAGDWTVCAGLRG